MRAATTLLVGSLVATVSACGPNLRSAYEADQAWNQCTSMDQVSMVPDAQRQQCWLSWKANYAQGQSSERIAYATQRLNALSSSSANAPATNGASGTTPQPAWAAPAPTTQPPQTPAVTVTSSPNTAVAPALPSAETQVSALQPPVPQTPVQTAPPPRPAQPNPECASRCGEAWNQCTTPCTANDAACIGTCDGSYVACMNTCK